MYALLMCLFIKFNSTKQLYIEFLEVYFNMNKAIGWTSWNEINNVNNWTSHGSLSVPFY